MHKITSVLRVRNFFVFVLSQTVSQFGDKLDYIALIGLIGTFAPEREPILLSQLAIFFSAPVLIFGPISGVLVDRWNRKYVMVTCDILRGTMVCLIPLVFVLFKNIYPVFALVFLLFLFTLFFNTARLSIIPDLVKREDVLVANSVATFVGRFATFAGMVLGGLIIDWDFWISNLGITGWQAGFFLDGVTFYFSALFLATITIHLMAHKQKQQMIRVIGGGLKGVLIDLKEVWHLVLRLKAVTYVFASVLILVFAASAVYIFVIPMVQHGIKWGTKGVGFLGGFGGIGLLIGAFTFGIFGHQIRLKDVIFVGIVIFGVGLFLLTFIKQFLFLAIFAFVGGLCLSPVFIAQETILHHTVPDLFRGRIFSSREWLLAGSFALFSLINGAVGSIIDSLVWLKIVGVIVVTVSVLNRLIIGRYAQDNHVS